MEFRNLTPFHALAYNGIDVRDQEFHVVVMRIGYQLVQQTTASQAEHSLSHACELLDQERQPTLIMADTFEDETANSSPKAESDLAPFKPRCDVLVKATAHTPGRRPSPCWPVHFRVRAPDPVLPDPTDNRLTPWQRAKLAAQHRRMLATRRHLIDKSLRVFGARHFERTLFGWVLSDPESASAVPIRWENTFGGTSCVTRFIGGKLDSIPLLNEVCFTNPVGTGWIEKKFEKLAQPTAAWKSSAQAPFTVGEASRRIRAPQIEYAGQPIETLTKSRYPAGPLSPQQMAQISQSYPYQPAGLGPVGRAWTPRLQLGGTYDENWQRERWPYLPKDFNFGYWNCAPQDQQIQALPREAVFELLNLAPPEQTSEGWLRFQVPPHRAFMLLRYESGALAPLPMRIDTVQINTEEMNLELVWRAVFPVKPSVRVAEARFELNPAAPLARFALSPPVPASGS
jgi:hypothetical protein